MGRRVSLVLPLVFGSCCGEWGRRLHGPFWSRVCLLALLKRDILGELVRGSYPAVAKDPGTLAVCIKLR